MWDCEAKASMKETGLVSMKEDWLKKFKWFIVVRQEPTAFLSILIKDNQEFVFRWEMMMMGKYCANSPISHSCFWKMIYDHATQEVGRSFLGHFQGTIHFFLSLSISISSVSSMFPTGKDTTSHIPHFFYEHENFLLSHKKLKTHFLQQPCLTTHDVFDKGAEAWC